MWYSKLMKNVTILELRKQTGLSQSQFAKEFHIHYEVVEARIPESKDSGSVNLNKLYTFLR